MTNEEKKIQECDGMMTQSDREILYECCSGFHRVDKRLLNFIMQICILASILIFSMISYSTTDNQSEKTTFLVIISSIMSVFLPTPKLPQRDNRIKKEKKEEV